MATRKDQLQSYQFMLQRSISALVMRETDPAVSPLRRGVGAAFVGVMVAIIVAAAFGIYGLLTKSGNAKWQKADAIVVERETGAKFVFRDGKLIPALNMPSAMLLSGQAPPTVFNVARNSLKNVVRDSPRGIEGAPGTLPDKKKITSRTWSLCALGNSESALGESTQVTLLVGESKRPATELGDRALIVADQDDPLTRYLIYRGYRHQIVDPGTVLGILYSGLGTVPVVGKAWIDGIPEGDDIGPVRIPDAGRPSAVSGYRIGEVLRTRKTDADDYYLVFPDGVGLMTPMQLSLYTGESGVAPRPVEWTVLSKLPTTRSGLLPDAVKDYDPPERTPALIEPRTRNRPMCVEYSDNRPVPTVLVGAQYVSLELGTETPGQTRAGRTLADRVAVPPTKGAVVKSRETGAYSLVTDDGVRYPIASSELLAQLGLPAGKAVELPADIVNRLPTGPTLSESAAKQPVVPPDGD